MHPSAFAHTAPPPASITEGLNQEQKEAVESLDGPLLVLAGAGTGKTKVLTCRIANLIMHGVFPSQILSVTFTNKAAREMNDRIVSLVGDRAQGLWAGTFHSICAKMLRRHAPLVGLKDNFTIIDSDDQLRLLKQLLKDHGIDEKRWPAKLLASIINRFKDQGLTPAKLSRNDVGDFANGRTKEFYTDYQHRLKVLNAVDFGDLLLHSLTLLMEHNDVLEEYHRRFSHILVDEYQDTNVAQYLWLRLLAKGRNNICCVGDDDQSIYGWRGAEVGNILRFEKDFKDAKVIRLERNYRSTSHILSAASHIITHNEGRLGKTLWTDENNLGELISLMPVWDDNEEARRITDEIDILQRDKISVSQMAILVRASFQTRSLEECFMTQGIPYRVIGGLRFYERKEIRDVIAYLRLVAQPDDSLAFERIVNTPKRGVGQGAMQQIHIAAREADISLPAACRLLLKNGELKGKASTSLKAFCDQCDQWRAASETLSLAELAQRVVKESGYWQMYKSDTSLEAAGRIENIKEMFLALEEFESLLEFLEHVSLVVDTNDDPNQEYVSIMTLHAAKGLEFDVVFLSGWEEGIFPHQRAISEEGKKGLEEERRLAYVGITRARKRLFISYAANRRVYGKYQSSIPSRFIKELPDDHVQVMDFGHGLMPSPSTQDESLSYRSSYPQQRMKAKSSDSYNISRSESFSASKKTTSSNATSRYPFPIGTRVQHVKFGRGKVIGCETDKVSVAFDDGSIRKIMSDFISAAS